MVVVDPEMVFQTGKEQKVSGSGTPDQAEEVVKEWNKAGWGGGCELRALGLMEAVEE